MCVSVFVVIVVAVDGRKKVVAAKWFMSFGFNLILFYAPFFYGLTHSPVCCLKFGFSVNANLDASVNTFVEFIFSLMAKYVADNNNSPH